MYRGRIRAQSKDSREYQGNWSSLWRKLVPLCWGSTFCKGSL